MDCRVYWVNGLHFYHFSHNSGGQLCYMVSTFCLKQEWKPILNSLCKAIVGITSSKNLSSMAHSSVFTGQGIPDDDDPSTPFKSTSKFNKQLFHEEFRVFALSVNCNDCSQIIQKWGKQSTITLNRPKKKKVLQDPDDPNKRLILLDVRVEEGFDENNLPTQVQVALNQLSQVMDGTQPIQVKTCDLVCDYDDLSTDQALSRLLPSNVDIPSSFEMVGHLAHVNLRDEVIPFKGMVGQVIIEKNRSIRTVVNKIGTITNEFRVFDMEVIAGDPDFDVEVRESGCYFRFNFSQVYWNSRLQMEHSRMVKRLSRNDIIGVHILLCVA